MSKIDQLLHGAIDMHCHGFPEFSSQIPYRFSNEDHGRLMLETGMKGCVLKSHLWPTAGEAFSLNQALPGLNVIGSITLNSSSGGLALWSLEAAIKQGIQVVWMPTWSARNDVSRNGIIHIARNYLSTLKDFSEDQAISIINDKGELLEEAKKILTLLQENDIVLFTGHISPLESLAMAREAHRIGFVKLIFGHPDSRSVGGTFEHIQEITSLGAYVELCALGLMPLFQRISMEEMKKIIQTVGANKCILTTDYFFEWSPPVPEMLRMVIGCLLEVGISEQEIKTMVSDNPSKLLNL